MRRRGSLPCFLTVLGCLWACDASPPPPSSVYEFLEGGGVPVHQVAATWAALPYSVIEVQRFPGHFYGTSDPYHSKVILRRGGTAMMEGTLADGAQGPFTGEVDLWDYARLCQLLDEVDVESFEPSYEVSSTHQETVTLRVVRAPGTQAIEVREYGQAGPATLWAVRRSIDAIARGIDWQPAPAITTGK